MAQLLKICLLLPGDASGSGSIPGSRRSPGVEDGSHSGILAWKISWTEELCGLQFMGLQRVGYN